MTLDPQQNTLLVHLNLYVLRFELSLPLQSNGYAILMYSEKGSMNLIRITDSWSQQIGQGSEIVVSLSSREKHKTDISAPYCTCRKRLLEIECS